MKKGLKEKWKVKEKDVEPKANEYMGMYTKGTR